MINIINLLSREIINEMYFKVIAEDNRKST